VPDTIGRKWLFLYWEGEEKGMQWGGEKWLQKKTTRITTGIPLDETGKWK